MLLSSPSFSDFLDRLSSNPAQVPQGQQAAQSQTQEARQLPKDVSPFAAQQQLQQQQIGMAMIPEQTMDFSMLSLEPADGFSFQPQVYAVLETPEPPTGIDTSVLSGKTSNFVGEQQFESDDDKVEIPVIERPAAVKEKTEIEVQTPAPVDEEFESDPSFALYHDATSADTSTSAEPSPAKLDTEGMSNVDIFGGIEPEKALARYELVDASEDDTAAVLAMARVQRISASLDDVMARLERLTCDS